MYEFSQPNAVEYSWSWSNMAKALANFNSWICMISVGIGFFCACLTHNFFAPNWLGSFFSTPQSQIHKFLEKSKVCGNLIFGDGIIDLNFDLQILCFYSCLSMHSFFIFYFDIRPTVYTFPYFYSLSSMLFFYDIYLQNSIILLWHIVLKWIFQNS